jgi:hypothetical protein
LFHGAASTYKTPRRNNLYKTRRSPESSRGWAVVLWSCGRRSLVLLVYQRR